MQSAPSRPEQLTIKDRATKVSSTATFSQDRNVRSAAKNVLGCVARKGRGRDQHEVVAAGATKVQGRGASAWLQPPVLINDVPQALRMGVHALLVCRAGLEERCASNRHLAAAGPEGST